jgi:rhodanese-related sulfurtransferase
MVGEIQPETLRKRLEAGDEPVVLDIRSQAAFDDAHLPGSRNVPLPEIPRQIDDVADAEHVVTVCPHGKASLKAARIVEAYQDFEGTVESLAGGLEAWDGPIERESDPEEGGERPDAPF